MEILIGGSGCLSLCVRIQGVITRSIVLLIPDIWLLFEMLLLFYDFLPTLCSMGCHPMFLGMSTVLRWCRPIYVPGIGVWLSTTGLLLRSGPHYYVFWILERYFPLGGCDRCCVWVHGIFWRIWCRHSRGCVLVPLPLWGSLITHMTVCQIRSIFKWVDR